MRAALQVLTLGLVCASAALVAAAPPAVRAQDAVPRLVIDADPSNNSRPCDPIDAKASVAVDEPFDVQICLGAYTALGSPASLTLAVAYPDLLSAESKPADDDLYVDVNPDLNQGAGPSGLGEGWDCDFLDEARSRPRVQPSPALMNCFGPLQSATPGALADDPGLVATMTLRGRGDGVAVVELHPATIIGFPKFQLARCSDEATMLCAGAEITVGKGGAVSTPASTNAPSASAEPAPSPGAEETAPAAAPTARPAASPAPAAADREKDDGGSDLALWAGIGAAVLLAAVIAAAVLTHRRPA